MSFDLADDMDSAFLDSGFEEAVSYIVDGVAPETKPIKAIVFRGMENKINFNIRQSGSDAARQYRIEAYISRTDIPAVQVNADKFVCKRTPGDSAASTFKVAGIIGMDEGGYRIGLA